MLILGLGLILLGVVVMLIMRGPTAGVLPWRDHHPRVGARHAPARASGVVMTRYGPQFGPDFTFLGVPECDLDDESSYADADVVILGAPFDGGTSYRAGTRASARRPSG